MDPLVQGDRPVHLASKVHKEEQDIRDPLVLQDSKEQQVPLVYKVPQVQVDPSAHRDLLAVQVQLALLAFLARQDLLDPQDQVVLKGLKEQPGQLVQRVRYLYSFLICRYE
jgi:hypothetical protein